MSSIRRLWRASREDAIAAIGGDSRPARPGDPKRVHPEDRQKALLKHLQQTGQFNLNDSGFRTIKELLRATQGRSIRIPKASKK